ncbi:MAG TPA: alpha-glucosidase [Noviherbaspirillum sp.]|uniref:alpha-glucosidase n=1 Tax=Oxalobacteraceae TaxID=75682 RepID=UPI0010A306EE|nr:alpha-glucosidase [Herbaspirillum sp. ST 5-3]HJV53376.1 alpha-glucosidase [Noviherbaspirillum sp.]
MLKRIVGDTSRAYSLKCDRAPDWWRKAVIYQVYPRSFCDSNGDGIGDLPGITGALDYIARLGADIVWISPFFTSPMKDFGYDVSDYCDVDPMFGTLADFDRLIERAHALGLCVMVDQVLSHTSDQHPWFIESRSSRDNPKADWYVWADPKEDGTPPNNWLSVFGGSSWQWDTRRRQFYLHNFLSSQPDLNFHHPEVRQAHLDNLRFWLERGVDGFRLDACNFHFHDLELRDNPAAQVRDSTVVCEVNPYGMQSHLYDKTRPENIAFLASVRTLLDEYGAISIGEVGAEDALGVMADYTGSDRLHMAYSFNLLTTEFSAAHIRTQVEQFEQRVRGGWASWSVGNHDSVRVATRWGGAQPSEQLAKLVLAMQLSLKGTPCLYQGDELAMTEADLPLEALRDPYGIAFWPEFKGRDGCRTPMPWQAEWAKAGFTTGEPWLPIPPEHAQRAVDVQLADPTSPLSFARNMLAWRRNFPQLSVGDIFFFDAPESVLAFRRELQDMPGLLAAFNLSDRNISFEWPQAADAAALDGHGLPGTARGATVTLPPYGAWYGLVHNITR